MLQVLSNNDESKQKMDVDALEDGEIPQDDETMGEAEQVHKDIIESPPVEENDYSPPYEEFADDYYPHPYDNYQTYPPRHPRGAPYGYHPHMAFQYDHHTMPIPKRRRKSNDMMYPEPYLPEHEYFQPRRTSSRSSSLSPATRMSCTPSPSEGHDRDGYRSGPESGGSTQSGSSEERNSSLSDHSLQKGSGPHSNTNLASNASHSQTHQPLFSALNTSTHNNNQNTNINNSNGNLNNNFSFKFGSTFSSEDLSQDFGWPSWLDPGGKLSKNLGVHKEFQPSIEEQRRERKRQQQMQLLELRNRNVEIAVDVTGLRKGKGLLCGDGWKRKGENDRTPSLAWKLTEDKIQPTDPRLQHPFYVLQQKI